MIKKVSIVLALVFITILDKKVFAVQTGDHYYKAVVPFIAKELKGKEISLYQFIGVDVWSNNDYENRYDPGLIVQIEDYSLPQPALVGDIEDTNDSNIKNVICVWRSEYDYDTYSSKYGEKAYAYYYISKMRGGINYSLERAVISANHDDYNQFPHRKAVLPQDSAYYEEISQEEYNRYIYKTNSASINTKRSKSSYDNDIDEDLEFILNEQLKQYKIQGWHYDKDGWRYFDKNTGKALSGWQKIDGAWYYFMPGSCVMQTNTVIDGYVIGADGKMIY